MQNYRTEILSYSVICNIYIYNSVIMTITGKKVKIISGRNFPANRDFIELLKENIYYFM